METDISIRFSYGQAVFLNAVCKGLRVSHFILKMYRPCRIVCPRDRDSGNNGAEQPTNAVDDGGSEEDEYEDDEPTSDEVKKENKSMEAIQEEEENLEKKKLKPTAPETLNLTQSRPRGTLGPHSTR